jgi:hypothetical protein
MQIVDDHQRYSHRGRVGRHAGDFADFFRVMKESLEYQLKCNNREHEPLSIKVPEFTPVAMPCHLHGRNYTIYPFGL